MLILFKSKVLLTIVIVTFAVIFSELLVFTQMQLFWPDVDREATYTIAFWTPLIDGFIIVFLLIYMKSVYEKKLYEKNVVLEEAKKIAKIGEWEINLDTMKASFSENVLDILGEKKSKIDTTLNFFENHMGKEDWSIFQKSIINCIVKKEDHTGIYKIKNIDTKEYKWIETRAKITDNKVLGTIQDITEIKKTENRINNYLELIDENIITSSTDLEGNITSVSKAFCKISGYKEEELLHQNHRIVKSPDMKEEFYKALWETLEENKTWTGEIKNLKKDGTCYWVLATIYPSYEDGKKVGYTAIRQDISDKKRIEEISITDGLTNIYNRRYFNEIFPKLINSTKRENSLFCFLIMDVDYFKQFNDTYGHQRGDLALIQVAKNIKDSLKRAGDFCFRLGGEEFGVIFKADTKEKALVFANKIKNSIEGLEIIHEKTTCSNYITVSIGLICEDAKDIKDSDTIYKKADDLLYKAKDLGRNVVCTIED